MADKHGIELHYVRPDRVYATSVWTPIVGYQPVSDAMQVAARFVADRGLAGPGLGGLPGLIQKMKWRRLSRRAGVFYGINRWNQQIPTVISQKNGFGAAGGLGEWIRNMIAGFKARMMAAKLQRQLAQKAANGQPTVVSVDTSPRQTGAAQIVDAVRGLLPMPSISNPMSAATRLQNQQTVVATAPTVSPQAAAYAVTPGAHDMTVWLSNQWRQGY